MTGFFVFVFAFVIDLIWMDSKKFKNQNLLLAQRNSLYVSALNLIKRKKKKKERKSLQNPFS